MDGISNMLLHFALRGTSTHLLVPPHGKSELSNNAHSGVVGTVISVSDAKRNPRMPTLGMESESSGVVVRDRRVSSDTYGDLRTRLSAIMISCV